MADIYERLANLDQTKKALLVARLNKLLANAPRKTNAPGAKRLVAYVVPREGQTAGASELRGFVSKKLPDYMAPSAFVFLDELPLTSSGKIDRKALPPPNQSASGSEAEFVAPRNAIEEVLSEIWAEVLQIDRVSARADFFELGGHSLAAAQVVYRIRDLFHVELPVRGLFEGPTVEELARALESRETKPGRMEKIAAAYKKIKIGRAHV